MLGTLHLANYNSICKWEYHHRQIYWSTHFIHKCLLDFTLIDHLLWYLCISHSNKCTGKHLFLFVVALFAIQSKTTIFKAGVWYYILITTNTPKPIQRHVGNMLWLVKPNLDKLHLVVRLCEHQCLGRYVWTRCDRHSQWVYCKQISIFCRTRWCQARVLSDVLSAFSPGYSTQLSVVVNLVDKWKGALDKWKSSGTLLRHSTVAHMVVFTKCLWHWRWFPNTHRQLSEK